MKIYISTLLLTIKVFLRFDEINTSGVPGASSSSRPSREAYLRQVQKDPNDGPPHKIVNIGEQLIEVWLDPSRRHIVKAWYDQDCFIPQADYFKTKDFLIRIWMLDGRPLVAYISKENVLIGVRPMQKLGERQYAVEPTPSRFYIIYSRCAFRLAFNVETQKVTDISLVPHNVHKVGDKSEHVEVAGLQFTVYRGTHNYISGAVLGFQPLGEDQNKNYIIPQPVKLENVEIKHVKQEYKN